MLVGENWPIFGYAAWMARSKSDEVEIWLRRLRDVADEGTHEQLTETVLAGLEHSSSYVVAQAATLVPERELAVSGDLLVATYRRFLEKPTETDKGCRAKLALAEALTHLAHEDADFFIEGMSYTQVEPAYPSAIETAPHLRGACAYGLVRCMLLPWTAVMPHLVDLLNDADPVARSHAANAIAHLGTPAATSVLRLKALIGDSEAEVTGACLAGMLKNDGNDESAVEFVARYLNSPGLSGEAAAALCGSRNEGAIDRVIDACMKAPTDQLELYYLSLALCRQPSALQFLYDQIAADHSTASLAIKSLTPNRFYVEITERVSEAAERSGNPSLMKAFESGFASNS